MTTPAPLRPSDTLLCLPEFKRPHTPETHKVGALGAPSSGYLTFSSLLPSLPSSRTALTRPPPQPQSPNRSPSRLSLRQFRRPWRVTHGPSRTTQPGPTRRTPEHGRQPKRAALHGPRPAPGAVTGMGLTRGEWVRRRRARDERGGGQRGTRAENLRVRALRPSPFAIAHRGRGRSSAESASARAGSLCARSRRADGTRSGEARPIARMAALLFALPLRPTQACTSTAVQPMPRLVPLHLRGTNVDRAREVPRSARPGKSAVAGPSCPRTPQGSIEYLS
ncbi:hypothetical protein B0H10DRAFT_2112686 [Mycena sp. CBHHK59/15]|nr:hypothetical protein B0H10DRAFT_2112686 [Mycena sp. CBHHK59/15]